MPGKLTTPGALDFAADRTGKVPVKVKVTNKQGTTFERTVYKSPEEAKKLKAQQPKGQGAKVTGAVAKVLQELAKIPKDQRPAGWQQLVKELVDPRFGGRLGKRRNLLHEIGRQLPKDNPLRTAARDALKADAPKGKELRQQVKRKKKVERKVKARKVAVKRIFEKRAKSKGHQTKRIAA